MAPGSIRGRWRLKQNIQAGRLANHILKPKFPGGLYDFKYIFCLLSNKGLIFRFHVHFFPGVKSKAVGLKNAQSFGFSDVET